MAETYNWDTIQKEAGGQFSPLAKPGNHTAKVDTVDVRETKNAQGNTTYWLDLVFLDEGTAFPKVSHPISFKNKNWRMWHFMSILKELGIPEDKAKKAIETAESKTGDANIVAAYHATFDRATQKHPELSIEVYESDAINQRTGRPYLRADFTNSALAFAHESAKPVTQISILDGAEDVSKEEELTLDGLGF